MSQGYRTRTPLINREPRTENWKLIYFLCLLLAACGGGQEAPAPSTVLEALPVTFTDVTQEAGISFTHFTGAYGKKYFPETNGSGGGFFDYDGDGWEDLLLINGKNWPSNPGPDPTLHLYRNQGDGSFEDVTEAAGLNVPIYGMGMAAADYDNDGDADLLITATGPNHFFRNDGGVFTDMTAEAGLEDNAWSSSAMFFDYDKDGFLDLYVANYVKWTEETDLWCTLDGETKSYCTPEIYTGEPSHLYHNRGDGTFEEVSRAAGVYNEEGKAFGVALLDFNEDNWPDFVVANDTQPDFLFRNNTDGTFEEVGLISGMALDESGKARAGMGVDVGVVDETGKATIFVGNFSNEMIGVYRDIGNGTFIDRAAASRIGRSSLLYLTFALFLFDFDLDFDLDLFAVNGHVEPEVERIQQSVTFAQLPLLYQNNGNGTFAEVAQTLGDPFSIPVVGRGTAYADYDRDGDLDLFINVNNGRPLLLRNEALSEDTAGPRPFVRVRLEGTESNRDGIGARVVARLGDRVLPQFVRTGSSYLSQSELTLTWGLGGAPALNELTVTWPSGTVDTLTDVQAGQDILIREGEGQINPR